MQPLEYGAPISLSLAKRAIDAAEREASANQWAMVIAVVDGSGLLVALHRMDHAQHGSIAVAQAKARTAAAFKRSTKVLEDAVAAGGLGLRILSTPDVCPLEGGLLLLDEGRIIGAIGVSGAQSTQDAHVAAAGARVVNGS